MLNCGILHIKTAPYHPQTNGEAERFVQTFKNFVKRADHDNNLNQRQIDEAILKFLMTYRCTPHSGTEMSPSYLMLNRQIVIERELIKQLTGEEEGDQTIYQEFQGQTEPLEKKIELQLLEKMLEPGLGRESRVQSAVIEEGSQSWSSSSLVSYVFQLLWYYV